MSLSNITDPNSLSLVWIGSFRYYLGRQTGATHNFCETLIQEIDGGNIPDNAFSVMKQDLTEKFSDDDCARDRKRDGYRPLGSDADRAMWLKVMSALSNL